MKTIHSNILGLTPILHEIRVQPAHGFPVAVAVASVIVVLWAGIQVGKARKRFNVPYPQMYAERDQDHSTEFNCVQRAHQNVLENYPQFLALLGLASVHRPAAAAVLGAIRLIGFIGYVRGYSKGDPQGRLNVVTASGYIGLIGLLGLSMELALRLAVAK